MRDDFYSLPANLPVPVDDGAADHLRGAPLPHIRLRSTRERIVDLAELRGRVVLFFYPRTGVPNEPVPAHWDEIPGARGCTPQSCGYRDAFAEFARLGVEVLGVSTQTTEFQQELVARLHLPYEVLSDLDLELTTTMKLPTFEFNGQRLLKRMAWVCDGGKVAHVFYPVFPPDQNAATVLAWLKESP